MAEIINRTDLYDLVKDATKEGLEIVQRLERDSKYIGKYYRFPEIYYVLPSGFPSFMEKSYFSEDVPTDYKYIFRKGDNDPEKILSWKRFSEFARQDLFLRNYWNLEQDTSASSKVHDNTVIYGCLESFIDRYMHISKVGHFEEDLFKPVYLEWECSILLQELPIDVIVPILSLTFPFEYFKIDESIFIEKMDNQLQLARNEKSTYTTAVHENVIGFATHALILKQWKCKNTTLSERKKILTDPNYFSNAINQVDNLFAAIRTVSPVDIGYSQIISRPINWADNWEAYLPCIYIFTVRGYPAKLENYGWLQAPAVIEAPILEEVSFIYKAISSSQEKRMNLASRRLNTAFLRTNDEDSILDITMGLETLLTSDTREEITYRLAIRAAALSSIGKFDNLSPRDVFELCKKIYDYRSSIIHGSQKASNKKLIKLKCKKDISAVKSGLDILRHIIKTLCHFPQYLDYKNLDGLLLEDKVVLANIVKDLNVK